MYILQYHVRNKHLHIVYIFPENAQNKHIFVHLLGLLFCSPLRLPLGISNSGICLSLLHNLVESWYFFLQVVVRLHTKIVECLKEFLHE